jgi:hypothetical protein
MKKLSSIYLLIIGIITCNIPIFSQTIEIKPLKDNTIYAEGDSSNAKGMYLFTGRNNKLFERRALLKFGFSSIQPTDSILSVGLNVYMSKAIHGKQVVGLYKMLNDWGEGSSLALYEEGGGAGASEGDATWNYSYYKSTKWGNKGGDFVGVPSAVAVVDTLGLHTWTGDTLLNDVKEWIKDTTKNFGWIMISKDTLASAIRFYSREYPDNPPVLEVQVKHKISGINNLFFSEVSVYPNPSQGNLNIVANGNYIIEKIRLFDISGRDITNQISGINNPLFNKKCAINISTKGIYFLQINNSVYKQVVVK